MPLDWLNTPLDADIGDLIARKKRAKTIELLRSQLQGRMVPPVQMRLQLADLLVQAGREAEAIPVLIGLADEFAGDGFVAKAVAILKRVERIQPGREDVESRLARLVKQQQRAAPAATSSPRQVPEFGIEEIREDAVEPAAQEEPGLPAGPPVVAEPPPPRPVADTDTTRRVRGVFRRFLASLPGGGPASPPTASPPTPPAPDALPATPSIPPVPANLESAPSDPVPAEPSPSAPEAAALPSEDTNPDIEAFPPAEETVPDSDGGNPAIGAAPEAVIGGEMATGEDGATTENPDTTIVDADAIEVDEPETDQPETGATRPDETETSPAGTEPHGVAGRIRGALRWLVSSLGTAEQAVDAPAESAARPPSPAAPAPEPAIVAQDDGAGSSAMGAGAEAMPSPVAPAAAATDDDEEPMSDEVFQARLLDIAQDLLQRPGSESARRDAPPLDRGLVLRYAQRLLATSLFGDLSEEELLAVVRGLRLHLHGAGDVLLTEGEPGQSIFVLASGTVKVFVRSPSGRNFPVAELRDGEFFGEISSLSGRPRSATVTAASRCELLELDRPTLDAIARVHPRVADVLEELYIRRASSPEAAAVRAVSMNDAAQGRKAIEVLEAHFGQSRWDPRMRLRLADVLLRAGKFDDAVPVLIGLADDLAHAGYPEKAIAVLKKIEKIRRRDIEVVNLAPRPGAAVPERRRRPRPHPDASPAAVAAAVRPGWGPQPTAEFFEGWLVDVLRDRVKRSETEERPRVEGERSALGSVRGYGPGLMATPLFEDFNDDELLAVIRGLRLLSFEAGDIIITEGEPGQSLFVLATGTVKVFLRDPSGRNVALCPLGEGAFFGEIATLSGRPRSATVTAASRCELLELDKAALEAILQVHPRVREVLEEHYIARANDPEAAAIRGTKLDETTPTGD
jgi:CRP-like cAMP-binding protein